MKWSDEIEAILTLKDPWEFVDPDRKEDKVDLQKDKKARAFLMLSVQTHLQGTI